MDHMQVTSVHIYTIMINMSYDPFLSIRLLVACKRV